MSFVSDFVGDVVGGITGADQAAEGAQQAAAAQAGASAEAIAEQRRQFDKLVELMGPYVEAGKPAIEKQKALVGLGAPGEEEEIINAIAQSPEFQALVSQGEEGILQGASATGGLRGGNIQAALAKFRPAMLADLINNRYARLGGLTSIGQAAAAGQAAAGQQTGATIADLLAQKGAAIGGGQIASGNVPRQSFGDLLGIAKTVAAF